MAVPSKVPTNQPFTEFPGGTVNALVDDYFQRRSGQRTPAVAPQRPARGSEPRLTVLVHNSTSEDIEPGMILGFGGPIFTLEDDADQVYAAPNLRGVTPDASEHKNQFCVALDWISPDEAAPAILMGLAWVKVHWTDDEHTHVAVEDEEFLLQSAGSGIKPVWHEEIPDNEYLPADLWALVMLGGGSGLRKVAITESFDGATWDGSEVTEETITVYDFNGVAPIEGSAFEVAVSLGLDSPRTITAGKFIRGLVLDGELIQAQCPEWDLPEGWGEEET